jgi:hypothetical protein
MKKHGINHYLTALALSPLSFIEQKETKRKLEERYNRSQNKQTFRKDNQNTKSHWQFSTKQ